MNCFRTKRTNERTTNGTRWREKKKEKQDSIYLFLQSQDKRKTFNMLNIIWSQVVCVTLIFIKLFLIKRKAYWNKPNHNWIRNAKTKSRSIHSRSVRCRNSTKWNQKCVGAYSSKTSLDTLVHQHCVAKHISTKSIAPGIVCSSNREKINSKTKARNELFLRLIATIICKQSYQICIFPRCNHFRCERGFGTIPKPAPAPTNQMITFAESFASQVVCAHFILNRAV